jgi:putative membrane protein
MKTLLRNTLFYSFALALLPNIIPGVEIEEGLITLLTLGFTLMLLFSILRPILNLISLPINLVTVGLFSILINTFLLYVLTVLVPSITISEFQFQGFSWGGFVIPRTGVNTFFAYVLSAITISAIMSFLNWLTD